MNTDIIEEYATNDVSLATFLKMKGHKYSSIEVAGYRSTFIICNVPKQLIMDFSTGLALIDPQEYARQMSNLTHIAKRMANEGRF